MNKEKSCGAVIYRYKDNKIYFLLSKMGFGHISLSKGHVEKGETELETAKREILEETSLEPEFDTNFRYKITYSPAKNVIKDVIFFVAEQKEDKTPIDLHDDEVVGFLWLEYESAYKTLSHDSDKEVLENANKYIKGKENGKF